MEIIERANQEAVRRILAGDPVLVDVVPAGQAIPALGERMILHAGPPVEWARMCGPMRGAVTWKSTVGTNVASDALSNLASAGVMGGTLIVLGEDYGEGASIIQERTHAFAMKSQIWLLDPRPNLPTIVKLVQHGFELSEASNTPVMLELRIRACHVLGRFIASDNRPPALSRKQLIEQPRFDPARICLPPATYAQEKHKIDVRMPAAIDYIARHRLNEVFRSEEHTSELQSH